MNECEVSVLKKRIGAERLRQWILNENYKLAREGRLPVSKHEIWLLEINPFEEGG
jgi:hypothetical protein